MNLVKLKKISRLLAGGWAKNPVVLLDTILSAVSIRPGRLLPRSVDDGYIMSLESCSDSIRFFNSLNCNVKPAPLPKIDSLGGGLIDNFFAACRMLNGKFGAAIDLDFISKLREELFLGDEVSGWPLFGVKIRPDGETALTLYFMEKRLGWFNLRRVLKLFSMTEDDLRRCGLNGVFECVGISFSSSGEKTLKIYTKVPVPSKVGELKFFTTMHGSQRLKFLKMCLEMGEVYPQRHWTNAYRFDGKHKKPDSAKTEVHFLKPVPAIKFAKTFFLNSGFLSAKQFKLIVDNDCSITTLSAEKRRLTAYFTC